MFTIGKIKSYYDNLPNEYSGYDDSYRFIIENIENEVPFAFARFNDGEIIGIQRINTVVSRGSQIIDQSLQNALNKSIRHRQKNYYVGIPCEKCYPQYHKTANNIVGNYEHKKRAVCNINRNYAKFINEFKSVLYNRNIIWIGGKDQNPNNIEEVLNFKIKKSYLFSQENSWNDKQNIKSSLSNIKNGDIVLFSLGPTGRILCQELFNKNPEATFIDVGSLLDPITRNVWHDYHKGWDNGFNKTKKCKICN